MRAFAPFITAASPMPAPTIIRFGDFRLLPERRALRFRGADVVLGARGFDLLLALVHARGELATKDQLMTAVWADRIVDENNLAAQIAGLRKVLAADPALARCLQTVPGRGYRFVAELAFGTDTGGDARPPAGEVAGAEALSVVVLPFTSLGRDPEQGYFAQGLSQTITTDLSRIAGLLVIASATAATLEARGLDARSVSRELGVRYVLSGSVQRIGQTLRVTAQLADGQTGVQIWSELFDGDDTDLLALQDRITGRIANSLGREIFVAGARDGDERAIAPRSVDLLMRGIAADNRPQSLASLREQERLFARAAALDPDNADALARLSRAILLQVTQVHAPAIDEALLARGIAAAERAVALAPGNARAHFAMGVVHVLRREFEMAVLANEAAIALDRNFALAHNNLGNSLVHLGHGRDALAAARQALRLDPLGPQQGAFWTTLGFAHLVEGEIEAAVDGFARARAANPNLPRAKVGAAVGLALGGQRPAARRATAELLRQVPQYRLSETMDACLPGSAPRYRAFYAAVLGPGAALAGLPE